MPFLSRVASAWKSAWEEPGFRRRAFATPVVLLLVMKAYAWVLLYVERRPGVLLPDPVLAWLTPRDASGLIFGLVYGVILVGVVLLLEHPRELVTGTQAYAIMVSLRIVALYLMPLDPPPGMIVLRDPFTEGAGTGIALTRDLFFSGHTASVFLFWLGVPGKWAPRAFLLCAGLVGALVLVQHVHYAVDVAAAPLAAFAAYRLAVWAGSPAASSRPAPRETSPPWPPAP